MIVCLRELTRPLDVKHYQLIVPCFYPVHFFGHENGTLFLRKPGSSHWLFGLRPEFVIWIGFVFKDAVVSQFFAFFCVMDAIAKEAEMMSNANSLLLPEESSARTIEKYITKLQEMPCPTRNSCWKLNKLQRVLPVWFAHRGNLFVETPV